MTFETRGVLQRDPSLAWRDIDEETVIISPSESVMHELNTTGSFIWKNIDGQRTAADLAKLLVQAYEVSVEAATSDTEELLQELISRKLILPVPANAGEQR